MEAIFEKQMIQEVFHVFFFSLKSDWSNNNLSKILFKLLRELISFIVFPEKLVISFYIIKSLGSRFCRRVPQLTIRSLSVDYYGVIVEVDFEDLIRRTDINEMFLLKFLCDLSQLMYLFHSQCQVFLFPQSDSCTEIMRYLRDKVLDH